MGIFTSCCKPSASDVITPDVEARRQRLVEAAEKRQKEEGSRGIRDPEKLRKAQEKQQQMEKLEQELASQGGANLKWTSN